MTAFTTILYTLSSAFLIPVIVLLIGLFGWSLLTMGDFLRETLERRRRNKTKTALTEKLEGQFFEVVRVSQSEEEAMLKMDDLIDATADHMTRKLEKTDLCCRVAPMLGLMGTLIPLGPALMALSGGDMETLAKKLVVAFTTTVIGLATSALSLWVGTVRRRWYDLELREINRMANRLLGQAHVAEIEETKTQQIKEIANDPAFRKMDSKKAFRETASA